MHRECDPRCNIVVVVVLVVVDVVIVVGIIVVDGAAVVAVDVAVVVGVGGVTTVGRMSSSPSSSMSFVCRRRRQRRRAMPRRAWDRAPMAVMQSARTVFLSNHMATHSRAEINRAAPAAAPRLQPEAKR